MNIYNITDVNSLITDRKIVHGSLKPSYFHLNECNVFRNISQTHWRWLYFRVLCFELMDFNKNFFLTKTCWLHCSVDSKNVLFGLSDINNIFSLHRYSPITLDNKNYERRQIQCHNSYIGIYQDLHS